MDLPIVLGNYPKTYIRIDLLPALKGKFTIHFHLSESLENAHLKLEYDNTDYCLSLYIFGIRDFYKNKKVRVRSYDLWPKEIMFNASIGKIIDNKIQIIEKKKGYRDDAVIVDRGSYSWNPPVLKLKFDTKDLLLEYKVSFYREVRYYSPKYGFSVRSEYWFKPL